MREPVGRILQACVTAAALIALSQSAQAHEDYPGKPVRVIVPSVAGGGLDALARTVAQKLNEKTGAPFIVDNRPGAGGAIGIEAAARAAPDGYTLLVISATHAATSTLQGRGVYDLTRDFAPIAWATTQPYIVNVNMQVPAHSVKELIALAKAKPGQLSYGSPGNGSAQHLAGVLFASLSGAQFFHVPYKGGAQVVSDVIGGQIQLSFTNYLICRPHIESGRLRALAVTTLKRSPALPDLPAVSEVLAGYDADNWYGFVAPARTTTAVLDRLHREVSVALQAPELKRRLQADAAEIVTASRKQFGIHLAREIAKWGEVIRKSGIAAN